MAANESLQDVKIKAIKAFLVSKGVTLVTPKPSLNDLEYQFWTYVSVNGFS